MSKPRPIEILVILVSLLLNQSALAQAERPPRDVYYTFGMVRGMGERCDMSKRELEHANDVMNEQWLYIERRFGMSALTMAKEAYQQGVKDYNRKKTLPRYEVRLHWYQTFN
jgi:hypothetical protein